MKMRVKYVVEDVDRHGNIRLYFRKGGRKTRLPGVPGSAEFAEAYSAAWNGLTPVKSKPQGKPAAAKGTFTWLCMEYFGSAEFKGLDDRTKLLRRRLLERLCDLYGKNPIGSVQPHHIRKMRDARADKPEAANSFVKALRQVFHFASAYGYLHYNPARDVPYIKRKGDGFHTWTEAEIEKFEEAHPIGSQARLAFDLMLYLGQRRSDAIRLGPQHIRDGKIEFTQHKNRARNPVSLAIPLHPKLRESIGAGRKRGLVFIATEFGKAFSDAGFGNRFRKWCDEAGLPNCTAHGLRKAAATRLAEAGCSELEIMAITGHRSSKQVAVYTRAANRTRMGETAIAKLIADQNGNKSVPLPAPVEEGGTIPKAKALKS